MMEGFPPIRKKYIVLEKESLDEIVDVVNNNIHDGYRPVGGVQVQEGRFFQSLVYNGDIYGGDDE